MLLRREAAGPGLEEQTIEEDRPMMTWAPNPVAMKGRAADDIGEGCGCHS
jgi:hypothetical protein